MDYDDVNPKIAGILLQEDCEIAVVRQGRRFKFSVKIGPYLVATGTRKTREQARDDAAEALQRSLAWLKEVASK